MRLPMALPLLVAAATGRTAQAPPPAPASVLGFALSGSTTLGSQYIFRGLTQTDGQPTVQAELDWVHPAGFSFSASLSNSSWFTDQNAGFAKNGLLELGLYRDLYPGTFGHLGGILQPNTTEAYLDCSLGWATLKCNRVLGETWFGVINHHALSHARVSQQGAWP